jgi:molybdenum cofactor cytidylyltransferase
LRKIATICVKLSRNDLKVFLFNDKILLMKLNIILLAAGVSRRMNGVNKLLLPFKNKTVVQMTIENLIQANIGKIIVVTGHQSEQVQKVLEGYPIEMVFNPNYATGMTGSIQTGLSNVDDDAAAYMIALSDMPFIKPEMYQLLAQQFENQWFTNQKPLIIAPVLSGKRGNPMLFSNHFKPKLLAHDAPDGCKEIVMANADAILTVELATKGVFQDIDYWEDYEKIQKEMNL